MEMDKKDKFEEAFKIILREASTVLECNGDGVQKTLEWLKVIILYNVPHGKQIRGRMVELAFKKMQPHATEEQLELARILGWCVEILQAAFLIADDIMDKGETRRGRPCWYLLNNLGSSALNDAFMLEHFAFQLLRLHFGKSEFYADILDLCLGVTFKTILGQSLDIKTGAELELEDYNLKLYHSIVTYKTSYYTVYLPIALAMTLAGITKTKERKQLWNSVEEVAVKLGTLFQVQDDYFDCYADEQILGKVGTDIQEGKCTWLFVQAKEKCSSADFQELKNNYGIWDKRNVEMVKNLYGKLGMSTMFSEYQEELFREIIDMIKKIDDGALENILHAFLKTIYKRAY